MRSDDPAALKEIILSVQQRASTITMDSTPTDTPQKKESTNSNSNSNGKSDQPEETFSSRVRFMLQTIYDLKNNKQRMVEDSPAIHIKKSMKNYLNKRGTY